MTTFKYTVAAGILVALAVLPACSGPAESGAAQGGMEGAAALSAIGAIDRVAERNASRVPASGIAPSFIVDPSWPKPLPNNWRISQVGGISVGSNDDIWVYHRSRALDSSAAAALEAVGTNADGVPVTGLGHPRPYGVQTSGCCVPAPSVLRFDPEGNLLDAWGGPADPGFLEENCREEDGCYWPGREHGIFVDHNGYVYVSGNGQNNGVAQQQPSLDTFPWAATHGDDSHVLKFTAEGEFVYQIGNAGMEAPDSERIDGGPGGTPQPYLVAEMSVDPETNRLYIADGYGNRRILIVDAETGQYIGHFGAYGQNPVDDPDGTDTNPYDAGPWVGDYQAGNLMPLFFRGPLHCAKVAVGGLLYACDRGNNRIQVFDSEEVGGVCSNPAGEVGVCGFVGEVHVAPQTASGTSGTLAFSTDPGQTCLYVGDLANGTVYILNRQNLQELDRIGRSGKQVGEFHWVHAVAVDSQGNVYTGEVNTGERVQKFLRYGPEGCSGAGSTDVGLYSMNR
ncbi:MAG: hypothetical protein OXT72_09895 [Gammaproteobacteria bacterium]|nr:hypothetical protein [Gammaproteobacteria bacterium]MDE0248678.1 hypothetical protein [Gammaproteobacteria bacterium]